jgi:hypothetical protein
MSEAKKFVYRHGRKIEIKTLDLPDAPKHKRRQRNGFTTLPGVWKERLMMTESAAAWKLAVLILEEYWRLWRKGPVKLSNVAAVEKVGISRYTKKRGLRELEDMALVEVDRPPGRSPMITLLEAE